MKKALFGIVVLLAIASLVACSSSSGEIPDTGAVADVGGVEDIGPGLPPDVQGTDERAEEDIPLAEDVGPEVTPLPDATDLVAPEEITEEGEVTQELVEEVVPEEVVVDSSVVSSFEDLGLEAESFWNGADESGGFTSGDAYYLNLYNTEYMSWDGFSYSNISDSLTPGLDNQYGVIVGGGVEDSATFAVAHDGTGYGAEPPTVSLLADGPGEILDGLYVTNTAYAYYSMLEGDDIAKKFGGESGEDEDWFKLTVTGIDEDGNTTGPIAFYLADFRSADPGDDYIIDDWTWVDLKLLGQVVGIQMTVTSSDVGDWGMNTPGYFAIDGLRRIAE